MSSPLIRAHLAIVGRYCAGYGRDGHYAEVLTDRAGCVLCPMCADRLEDDRRRP